MQRITHITPGFAVSGALTAADFARIAAMGFKSVISNLPDGESPSHVASHKASEIARAAGLAYRHIPAVKFDIFSDRVLDAVDDALRELPQPVLAHCASGLRSAIVWAAVSARREPVETVFGRLRAAGFDLEAVREDVEARSPHRRTVPMGSSLSPEAPESASV